MAILFLSLFFSLLKSNASESGVFVFVQRSTFSVCVVVFGEPCAIDRTLKSSG